MGPKFRQNSSTFNASARLQRHMKERVVNKSCGPADLIEVLRLTRSLIDAEKSRPYYPTLAFYCDWIQHPLIDRNPQGFNFLEEMNRSIAGQWDRNGIDEMITEVSRSLSFASLRGEIALVFMSNGIPTDLTDSMSNWQKFAGVLLNDLHHREIRLSENTREGKKIWDQMEAEWRKRGHVDKGPARAFFIDITEKSEPGKRPLGYYWNVDIYSPVLTGTDSFILSGPIISVEKRMDFHRP